MVAQPTFAASGNYAVAPYVDMTNSQESLLPTAITSKGLKAFTAAFVIGEGCDQVWGDSQPVGDDPTVDPEISQAKADGASVIISSGGADGDALAWTCTNQTSIDQGYQALLNDYGVSWLDFDIEGAAQDDTASLSRQMAAMEYLEQNDPGFQFSVTIPVLPSGLTADGMNIINAAQAAGLKIPIVNIMTMDYGEGTSTEMGQAAISAAENTLAQIKAVNSSYTYANIGITPMIGINDDGSDFTLADAQTVETWAAQNGVGRLAFWSIDRDQSCPGGNGGAASSTCSGVSESTLQYTSTFVPFAGGGSSPTTTVPSTTTTKPATTTTTSKPASTTTTTKPATTTTGAPTTTTHPATTTTTTHPATTTTTTHPATTTTTAAGGGGGNLITNPTFSTGNLSGWTCDSGTAAVVTSPVYTGSYALRLTPTSGDDAECSQVVHVQPSTSYTLTAEMDGSYLFVGDTGTGTSDTSNWASTTSYQPVSTSFTTGSSTTSVTVWVHSWYAQPAGYVGEVSLVG